MFLVMSITQMNQIENKPWGSYEVLLDEPNYKVKRIVVDAYQRFSLQYHTHREEHWVIVDGSGTVEIKGREFQSNYRSHWVINKRNTSCNSRL